ncbi:MAG: 3-deoxy-7-phosphoheptulonate synthase [Acidobacteriota bacterium]|jgi:3-deoxy-7-phosphoheptulonate synthase|nr:3-deoxy-7-phosphoheptulonate synthase [Acidobacteriota bacterium]
MRIVRLRKGLSEAEKAVAVSRIQELSPGARVIGAGGDAPCFVRVEPKGVDAAAVPAEEFTRLENVQDVIDDAPEYALGSRRLRPEDTAVAVGGGAEGAVVIGGGRPPVVIAGPCAVEGYDQMARVAERLAALGVRLMRAGAYKPRTSPYAFQGLKKQGLEIMARVKREFGMKMVTEVMSGDRIDEVAEVADVLQVGSRNMFHYAMLQELGRQPKPVLLKRGMAAGMHEFLLAAEYVLAGGNRNVILCERGIKTFETATRNTLDLNVVPHVKQKSHLPILVDPSHGTGLRPLVAPMSLAALACGADGLLIEVHDRPEEAVSDGEQSITPVELAALLDAVRGAAAPARDAA